MSNGHGYNFFFSALLVVISGTGSEDTNEEGDAAMVGREKLYIPQP